MQSVINKEIRHYEEAVFMGLSLRQTFWSGAAVASAVVVYLSTKNILGQETVSWVCMAAAVPFATMGFFSYDGMSAWQFLQAVFRCEVSQGGPRLWKSENQYEQNSTRKKRRRKTHETE